MTKHLLLAADRWNSSYTLSSFVKFISQPIEWSKIRLAVAEKTRDAAYHLNVKSRYVNECHNFRSPSANQVGSSISNISNLNCQKTEQQISHLGITLVQKYRVAQLK